MTNKKLTGNSIKRRGAEQPKCTGYSEKDRRAKPGEEKETAGRESMVQVGGGGREMDPSPEKGKMD